MNEFYLFFHTFLLYSIMSTMDSYNFHNQNICFIIVCLLFILFWFGLHWFYLRAWFEAREADVFSCEAPLWETWCLSPGW